MLQGKKYTLWSDDHMDENSEEKKAEEFARGQKQMENQEKGKDKSKLKLDIRKFAIKSLGLQDTERSRISKSDSEEAKESFEKRKKAMK